MLTQVDKEGLSTTSLKLIIDYGKYEYLYVPKHEMYIATPRGQKKMRKRTVGWSLLVKWGNDSVS